MKIRLHDPNYSFDYVALVNDIFCKLIDQHGDIASMAKHLGFSQSCLSKFFQYKSVSMPTLLALASAADTNLMEYIIKIN